ncbi:dihydrodipicolinate reductase C-terminal domain-containing protein [Candidatus Vidania fulgoroideorum]
MLNTKNFFQLKNIVKKIDIIIDFSHKKTTMSLLKYCKKNKKKIIIGTTGFNKKEYKKILKYSNKIPIFIESNMNYNFYIFLKIISYSKKLLKKMDTHVIETHRKKKPDIPSGSCVKILKKLKSKNFSSLRIGEVVGEHEVIFCDKYNKINIKHECFNRNSFILLLKKIITFIMLKKKGIYNIKDL